LRWSIHQRVEQVRAALERADIFSSPELDQQLRITLWQWTSEYDATLAQMWENNLPLLIAGDEMWECFYTVDVPWVLTPFYRPWRTVADRVFGAAVCLDLIQEYHAGQRSGFFQRLRERGVNLRELRAKARGVAAADRVQPLARFAAVYDVFHAELDQPPEDST
jgi:hypothetical protein